MNVNLNKYNNLANSMSLISPINNSNNSLMSLKSTVLRNFNQDNSKQKTQENKNEYCKKNY